MTVKASISLTDEQHLFAKSLVDAGRFPSLSAILQQGVELLRRQIESESLEGAALAQVLVRRRTGSSVSGAKMDVRLARMLTRKRLSQGVRS
jgi:antitoxin ParD1/3/4